MNFPFPITLLALVAISGPAFATDDSVIEFADTNRDSLPGSLVGINRGELIWKSPLLTQQPTPFLIGRVLSLTRNAEELRTERGDYEAIVTLTNGDTLRGKLSAIADTQIVLATSYAGDIKLRRSMVRNLVIDSHPKLIFSGPTGMEGWMEISGKEGIWTYKDGVLESSGRGGLFRKLDLPDKISLSFDLEWRDFLSFRFAIFCDEPNSNGFTSNGYEVECARANTIIRKRRANGGVNEENIGRIHIPSIMENEKVRFELRGDRRNGKFQLLVDGMPVGDWDDPQPEPSRMGAGMMFFSEDLSSLRVSHIRVAAWDGTIKQHPVVGNEEEGVKEPKDRQDNGRPKMILRNGDVLVGDVVSIDHDIMMVKTDFGDVALPVSRAESFSLSNAGSEEPILKNGDIRAWFPGGGRVTFRLDAFADGMLRGFSQTFGDVSFKIDAFNRIEFNLYNPEFEGMRDERPEW